MQDLIVNTDNSHRFSNNTARDGGIKVEGFARNNLSNTMTAVLIEDYNYFMKDYAVNRQQRSHHTTSTSQSVNQVRLVNSHAKDSINTHQNSHEVTITNNISDRNKQIEGGSSLNSI